MKNIITLLSFALCLLMANTSFAVVATTTTTTTTEVAAEETTPMSQKEMRKQAKLQKKLAKLEKKMADGPFDDDVKKWRNFWLMGWGIGILLLIIGTVTAVGGAFSGGFGIGAVLYILGGLVFTFGSISLIVWLIKQFA